MNLFDYQSNLKNRKPAKGIHSYDHEIAKEVCDYFGVKEFSLWIGVARRIGGGELKAKLKYVIARGIKSSRYLLATCRNKKLSTSS